MKVGLVPVVGSMWLNSTAEKMALMPLYACGRGAMTCSTRCHELVVGGLPRRWSVVLLLQRTANNSRRYTATSNWQLHSRTDSDTAPCSAPTCRRSGRGLRAQDISMAWRCATGISGSDSTKGHLPDRQWRPASSSVGRRYARTARSLHGGGGGACV